MKYRHFVVIFSLTLLVMVGFVMTMPSSFADPSTIKIVGKYNAVLEMNSTSEGFTYFEEHPSRGIDDGSNNTGFLTKIDDYTDITVGKYNGKWYHAYIFFDLSQIPRTTWLDVVKYNSIQLNALVTNSPYTENKTFVTASYCLDTEWYKPLVKGLSDDPHHPWLNSSSVFKSENITSQDCTSTYVPIDSVVVDRNDMPKSYSWDLANATDVLTDSNISNFTIVMLSYPVSEITEISHHSNGSVVSFSSYENVYRGDIGINAVPSLTVSYTTVPTLLGNIRDLSTHPADMATVLSVIGAGTGWFIKKEMKKRKAATKHHNSQSSL